MEKNTMIFTLSCCSYIQGNKGNGGYISLKANSATDALSKGKKHIETEMINKGFQKKNLITIAFKAKNQKKAIKNLNKFTYFEGDPRL